MTLRQLRENKASLLLPACLIAAAFAIAVLWIFYAVALRSNVARENEERLAEVAKHDVAMINGVIRFNYRDLDAIAQTYLHMKDLGEAEQYLQSKREQMGYSALQLVEPEGILHGTDTIAASPCVSRALGGEPAVERVGEGILYAVPLRLEGQVIGAIAAQRDAEELTEILAVESFGGRGLAWVADREGNPVAGSEENVLAALEAAGTPTGGLRSDLQEGRSGALYLKGDSRTLLAYLPLEADGWYLFSSAPAENGKARDFIVLSVLLNAVIVLPFVALTAVLLHLRRSNGGPGSGEAPGKQKDGTTAKSAPA